MSDIETVRKHLFATLEALSDPEKPMDLERAKVITDVSQTIINSAKVEVDYIRATGADGSGFLDKVQIKAPETKALPSGITGITQHRIK